MNNGKTSKSVWILGISCFYHDSAASIVKDGEIIAAAQEERFTRKKHDFDFPKEAINYCLKAANIGIKDVSYVAFYDKPFIKFERILETYLSFAPAGIKSFLSAIPLWIKQKLFMKALIRENLGYEGEILFPEHHESHAASAFYPSPFKDAAILTIDGVGEWTTTSYGIGKGNDFELLAETRFPHSLGLLYAAFTYYTGFKVNSGEYKVMGLAPYGEPKYVDLIKKHLVHINEDGSFKLNLDYFNYCVGLTMTNKKFARLFGGPPRKRETLVTQKEMDIAKSIQVVTEEIMIKMARHIRKVTGMKNLCMAGGVALNCVANGKVLSERIFDDIWIQPAAGDAGGALGAALLVWYKVLKNERYTDGINDCQEGSYLGPFFNTGEVTSRLDRLHAVYEKVGYGGIPVRVAELIENGNVVGWFQGRMEFGPRALGARSIIGDARNKEMQTRMNLKIKFRESFRPFAPSVLREKMSEWFEMDYNSPYMLLVTPVKSSRRKGVTEKKKGLFGINKLKVCRSEIPAVTHVDYSARVQSVDGKHNKLYYDMIKSFEEKTGCPVIINTSFNVRGEPIVCTPEEAYMCFMRTNMDYLVIENVIFDKKKQPPMKDAVDWKKKFELD
ncbi:MAG: carbamoyltransferase [Candidatus Auribacterota bacterium]|nr:carbamoyltransferase [Candidatus Auribacterota bacterium]